MMGAGMSRVSMQTGSNTRRMNKMNKKVIEVIDSELKFAKGLWEVLPLEERPLRDNEKPVEFWIMHMERYLRQAQDGCYGTDKTPALEAIRKLVALGVRCMENNETPKRVGTGC